MQPTLFARVGAVAAFPSLAVAGLVALAAHTVSASTFTAETPAELISAINSANATPEADTIALTAGATYTFTAVDNWWYGPNALPPIASPITIEGHGATLAIGGDPVRLRFFYIGADPTSPRTYGYNTPGAGLLTLRYLTLIGGKARGGNSNEGGGGAGLGGAIFNQGSLLLDGVTLRNNTAIGGNGRVGNSWGGGGMGADGVGDAGGGFGGAVSPAGSIGGSGNGGGFGLGGPGLFGGATGGGGGFGLTDNGYANGLGGGPRDGLGGRNNGGIVGGQGSGGGVDVAAGGIGAGGGVGGGGGGVGGGGFGGGGGGGNHGYSAGSSGGFGGGGGGGGYGSPGFGLSGFGGGFGVATVSFQGFATGIGGGGAGMGGAIFNHGGQLILANSTLSANTAQGGNSNWGGCGYGGAIFNLNGFVALLHATLAGNTVIAGPNAHADGGALYNLRYTLLVSCPNAAVTITNCLLANSTGGNDLLNNRPAYLFGAATDPNTGAATVTFAGANLVETRVDSGTATSSGPAPLTDDPLLAPFANYGGTTETFALLPGSPAINAGHADLAAGPPIYGLDQRRVVRFDGPDLGAFESQGFWFTRISGDNQSTPPGTAFADSLALSVTAYVPIEPVNGGIVTFTPPASGASATLSTVRATIAGGAVAVTATANATAGMYTIPASASGATSLRFTLANGIFTYATWAAAHFTTDELADPAIGGPLSDPDGAGLTNLQRYAFDLPASGPVSIPTELVYHGSGPASVLKISFPLRADGTDLRYAVMTSENLTTWEEIAAFTPDGTARTIAVNAAAPDGAKRYFVRVQVAQVP